MRVGGNLQTMFSSDFTVEGQEEMRLCSEVDTRQDGRNLSEWGRSGRGKIERPAKEQIISGERARMWEGVRPGPSQEEQGFLPGCRGVLKGWGCE